MRRNITTIFLLFIIGTMTSIGVAWIFALDLVPVEYEYVQAGQYKDRLCLYDTRNVGFYSQIASPIRDKQLETIEYPEDALPTWSSVEQNVQPDYTFYAEEASGWPAPSLKSIYHTTNEVRDFAAAQIDSGIRVGSVNPNNQMRLLPRFVDNIYVDTGFDIQIAIWVLPTKIIFSGFIFSILFWMLPWFFLICLISTIRYLKVSSRSKNHKCKICGYLLKLINSEKCPECGTLQEAQLPYTPLWTNRLLTFVLAVLFVAHVTTVTYAINKHVGPERIHLAALEGDIKGIEHELSKGINIDHPVSELNSSISGTTPLMWAVFGSHIETIEYLLKNGADIDATDAQGDHAIHHAANKYSSEVIAYLIESGANIEARGQFNMTPLSCATFRLAYRDVALCLIDHEAALNSIDQFARTPLANAIAEEDIEFAKLLIERGALLEIENAKIQPIEWAVRRDIKYVELLIDSGFEYEYPIRDIISTAVGSPQSAQKITLLHNKLNLPLNGESSRIQPVINAIIQDDFNAFLVLIKLGAESNVTDQDGNGILSVVPMMPINNYWWNNEEMLMCITSLDLNVDARNNAGLTPLMIHTKNRNYGAVKYLLDHNANPNLYANYNSKPSQAIDFLGMYIPKISVAYDENRERIQKMLLLAMEEYDEDTQ